MSTTIFVCVGQTASGYHPELRQAVIDQELRVFLVLQHIGGREIIPPVRRYTSLSLSPCLTDKT